MKCSHIIFPVWAVVGALFLVGACGAEEHASAAGSQLSLHEKEEFLITADVVKMERLSDGVPGSSRATLTNLALTHDAHVQTVDVTTRLFEVDGYREVDHRDSYRYNIAAYRLDRLLGLGMVPVTVARTVSGKEAAVSWWIDDVVMNHDEKNRTGKRAPDVGRWNRQRAQALAFQSLVYNSDPDLSNFLIDKNWKYWMIDFTRAFRRWKQLREATELKQVPRTFLENLQDLGTHQIRQELEPILTEAELEALLVRRDLLVRHFQNRIDKLGEEAVLLEEPSAAGGAATPPRVVAIGDIHGELDGLIGILRETGLVDDKLHWSGGQSVVVQTGDMMDRGAGTRHVLDLMMRLQTEAHLGGGKIEILLGNHEVINLLGDFKYVSDEIYASFVDEESEKRRRAAFKDWTRWLKRWARDHGRVARITSDLEERWMTQNPPGYVEYHEAFAPDGLYGRWILELPVAALVAGTLFQHAGLSPEFAGTSLDEINELVRSQILEFQSLKSRLEEADIVPPLATFEEVRAMAQRFQQTDDDREPSAREKELMAQLTANLDELFRVIFAAPSLMWYRGYAHPDSGIEGALPDDDLALHLDVLREAYGAQHVVAAHSVMKGGEIQSRLNGRLFLIDTGMLESHYGGRASALVFDSGSITAFYPGGERQALFPD